MGSILGGGKSKSSSGAINSSAAEVAKAAQAGGKQTSEAITNASQDSANSILGGSQLSGQYGLQGASTAADYGLTGARTAADIGIAGAGEAARGALNGADTSARAQQQALAYLQQADQLPSGLRDAALKNLGSIYGMSYGPNGSVSSTGGSITDRAMASPMYKAAVEQGENAVLRNASATGGLRSGSANENLAQVNQNALISAYNDQINGLQGLSALQSNANTIAGYTAGIGNTLGQGQINYGNILGQGITNYGNTLGQGQAFYGQTLGQGQANYGNTIGQGQITAAQTRSQGQISAAQAIADANNSAAIAQSQGQVAAAQSNAQASQNSANNTMGLVGLGLTAASFFSDRRLKSDIKLVGEERGIKKYKWTWNKLSEKFGLTGPGYGVMADEVEETHPDSVSTKDGFLVVDYGSLGVSHGY